MICFGVIHQKVIQAQERMEQAQKDVFSSGGHPDSVKRENECLHEFLSISKAEESYFKQKSRNQWLQLGDHNTTYFHRMVQVHTSKNYINMLLDAHGQQVVEVEKIKEVVVNFYLNLLGTDSLIFDSTKA